MMMRPLIPALSRGLLHARQALLTVLLVTLVSSSVFAKTALPLAADPALEARMMTLAAELRCLVCQNQSLADSNAELAVDLRNEMREQMRRGASDQNVIDYLVARYGNFVLYRPPLQANTLVLWSGPVIMLILGLFFLLRTVKRRRRSTAPEPSVEARTRARQLLDTPSTKEAS